MKPGEHIRGYLLKRNQDHRKANLLGAKYKRRWVELTADTLVYASSQQELLTGKIQVFSLHEIKWIKSEGDSKFQVKFPERALIFKVESGGSNERDRWVAALEQATIADAKMRQHKGNTEKLDQLKKEAEEMLLDPNSSDGSRSSTPTTSSSGQGYLAGQAAGLGPGTSRLTPSQAMTGLGLQLSTQSSNIQAADGDGRPPSPRSLLASAKAGSLFVNNTSSPVLGNSHSAHRAPATAFQAATMEQQEDYASESSDSDEDEESDLAATRQQQHHVHTEGPDSACDSSGHQKQSEAAAASSGSSSPRSSRRAFLQRRVTPGVMLINASPSAASSPANTREAIPDSATAAANAASSSTHSIHDRPVALCTEQQQPQQHRQAKLTTPAAQCPDSHHGAACDEVLRLDLDDLKPSGSTHSNPGGRPESAPQYRPGTPVKSCLRSSNTNSSSTDHLSHLACNKGSMSTPTSSAEAAAAAAAAVASLAMPRCSRNRTPSPSKFKASLLGSLQPAANSEEGKQWLEDNWDESSDADEPTSEEISPPEHGTSKVEERPFHVHNRLPPQPAAGGAVLHQNPMKGVAADNNWLNDDFDS